MRNRLTKLCCAIALVLLGTRLSAQDIDGIQEHPLITRYPGTAISWQNIENYMPYRIPVGPVTGYRSIADWIDTEGRVTRTFYQYEGVERTYSEVYKNYLDALKAEDFEILAEGISADRRGNDVASGQWLGVYLTQNPPSKPGAVNTMSAGTSSSGGAGAIVARKERAAGIVYAVINVEQHSSNFVGTLIDIVEVEEAETGLIVVDAEAIGADMAEYGRVVLDGILFDFDKATLQAESDQALTAITEFLNGNPDKQFYVVGHTDSGGSFSYNQKLSSDRARAVVNALITRFDIDSARLESHGVGPLVPVFSNTTDAAKEKNRRVELVEKQQAE